MIHPTAKIHPLTFVDKTVEILEGVVIWQFATVLADVEIGKNCSIGSGTEIGRGSVIGDHSRISAHVFLPSNSIVGERSFIGPGCVFTDDKYPRAGNAQYVAEPPRIEHGVSIGAGAIILPGVHIKHGAMIAAGAIVTRDVEPYEHVRGEPSRVKEYSRMKTERQELFVGTTVVKGDEHVA